MIPVNGNLGATSVFAGLKVRVSTTLPSLMASPVPRAAVAAEWLDPKLTLDTDSAAAITHASFAATFQRFRACVTGTGLGRIMNQQQLSGSHLNKLGSDCTKWRHQTATFKFVSFRPNYKVMHTELFVLLLQVLLNYECYKMHGRRKKKKGHNHSSHTQNIKHANTLLSNISTSMG